MIATMPSIPIGTPSIRINNGFDDCNVIKAYQRLEDAKLSQRLRFRDSNNQNRLTRPNNKRFVYPQPTFIDCLANMTVAGTAFNTYTTAKTVLPTNSLATLPPSYWTIGRCLEVEVYGSISNIVTTPGTITFQVMLGSIVVFTSGALQMNATAHTTLPFWFKALLTCRAVGSGTSANFMGMAYVIGKMFTETATTVDAWGSNVGFTAGAAVSDAALAAPATAPAVGTGFDSTLQTILDFWVGFSSSQAGNQIQLQQYKALSWA